MIKNYTTLIAFVILFCFTCNNAVFAQNWLDINSNSLAGSRASNQVIAISKTGIPYLGYSDASLGGRAVVRQFDGSSWVTIGTGGISSDYAHQLSLAVDQNSVAYIAFVDAGLQGQVVVKKFEGGNWISVGSSPISSGLADGLTLVLSAGGIPFISYTDNGRGIVKNYDGTNWVELGTTGFSSNTCQNLSLAVNKNNIPYLAYTDNAIGGKLTIRSFDGSNWGEVGESVSTGAAYDARLTLDAAGSLYVLYREFSLQGLHQLGKMKVKKFNGTSWDELGTAGFSDSWVFHASLLLDRSNTAYVAYRESAMGIGNPGVTKVKRFNGREWEEIGTAALSSGAVQDVALAMNENGVLYVAFADQINQRKAAVLKLDLPSLVITTKAPANLVLATGSDSGGSAIDQLTNVAQPIIKGTADAHALVTIYLAGNSVGNTTADTAGNWSYLFAVPLATGSNLITATATDAADNISAASASLTIFLDQTAPVVSGVSEGAAYASNRTISFSDGVAQLNQVVIASSKAVSTEGAHTVVVSDAAGNTTTVRFLILKTPPVASVVINNKVSVTNSNQALLSITAPGAVQMRFYDNKTTWTGWEPIAGSRMWTLSAGSGSKWVKLQVRDAAGNTSASVSDGIVLDQTVPAVALSSTVKSPTSVSSIAVRLTFSENVSNLTADAIQVRNAGKGSLTGSGRYYSLQVLPTVSEIITVTVAAGMVQDAAGNKNTAAAAFSISYVVPITAPVVTSKPVSVLTAASVSLGGIVTATGGAAITERGIVYSYTSTSPSIRSGKKAVGSGLGSYSTTLANLKAGIPCYARAYASNAIGTSYGAVQKFTLTAYVTPLTAPVVSSSAVSVLTAISVNLGGTVTATGGTAVTERGVVYSTTSKSPSINSGKKILGSGLGSFNTTLANIKLGITYYTRAYAINAKGITYGAVQIFTLPALPLQVISAVSPEAAEPAKAVQATLTSYPNPFQNNATIQFTVPTTTDYKVQVYDMNGNLVSNLKADKASSGQQIQVNLDGSNLKKGIYVIRLTTTAGVQNLKVICNN